MKYAELTEQRLKSSWKNLFMDPIDETIDMLIATGAIEKSGVDPISGNPTYVFSPLIQEIMPELYEEHLNEINRNIMALWEKRFVDMELLDNDPKVTLTDKAFDDHEIEQISREEQIALLEIKRIMIN